MSVESFIVASTSGITSANSERPSRSSSRSVFVSGTIGTTPSGLSSVSTTRHAAVSPGAAVASHE